MAAATQEEMTQALEAMRALQEQQQAELLRLAAESAELRDAVLPGAQLGALTRELVKAVNTFVAARGDMAAGDRRVGSPIDIKGLGKPTTFKNDDVQERRQQADDVQERFIEWLRKATGFVSAAYGASFRAVLEWAEDQEQPITPEDLEVQLGAGGADDDVDNIEEKDSQLHVALRSLTESFDIVLGATPHGVEALRRLICRWDPASGGHRRVILRQIAQPEKAKLAELPGKTEKWDGFLRRYQKCRAGGEVAQKVDDDIKILALEGLVPHELEQHLAMNRSRLRAYEQVRSEIDAYIGAKHSQGAISRSSGRKNDDPIDVDSFQKGKGKRKGKGKGKTGGAGAGRGSHAEATCWNCGKPGHRQAEMLESASAAATGCCEGQGQEGRQEQGQRTPWKRARPLGSRPRRRLLLAAWTSAASASSRRS